MLPRPASIVAATFAALVASTVTTQTPATARLAPSHTMSTQRLLAAIPVATPHRTGYERPKFELWTEHADGCNTRYKVLIRDATRHPEVSSGCSLTAGRWVSPYDGFTTKDPTKIQVDHVVPLAVAWSAGAWKWNANTRMRFANDLGTNYDLVAVSAHSNESKSDKGPDTLLKLGLSLAGLGERDAACQTYAQVLKQYPKVTNAMRTRVATEQASASC